MGPIVVIELNVSSTCGAEFFLCFTIISAEVFFFDGRKKDSATALSYGVPGAEKHYVTPNRFRRSLNSNKVYYVPWSL